MTVWSLAVWKRGEKTKWQEQQRAKKIVSPFSVSNFTLYAHHCFVVYSSSTCSWVRCCSSNLFDLSVLSPPLSVFHLLQVSVCLIEMPSSESSCVLDRCYQDRVIICTHTHYSLSCRALCPDCVNPLCPPHISLHPSTSTPLWWRHTRTHTHTRTTLHHYHCFSWRRVSAFVCNYRGLKWEGRIFKKREEDGWKRGKKKQQVRKKTHTSMSVTY